MYRYLWDSLYMVDDRRAGGDLISLLGASFALGKGKAK